MIFWLLSFHHSSEMDSVESPYEGWNWLKGVWKVTVTFTYFPKGKEWEIIVWLLSFLPTVHLHSSRMGFSRQSNWCWLLYKILQSHSYLTSTVVLYTQTLCSLAVLCCLSVKTNLVLGILTVLFKNTIYISFGQMGPKIDICQCLVVLRWDDHNIN